MKTNSIGMQTSISRVALVTAGILMIPVVAMQFSEEWDWKLFDFIVIGTLIFATGLMIELVRNKVRNSGYRTVLVIALVVAFLLTYVELAVGIFGTPFAGS